MNINTIFDSAWIPLLAFAISLGYGIVLIVTKNPGMLQNGKINRKFKDKEKYAVEAGKVLILLAGVSLLNCALILVSEYVALAEAIVGFGLFAVLWKRMTEKYGPV